MTKTFLNTIKALLIANSILQLLFVFIMNFPVNGLKPFEVDVLIIFVGTTSSILHSFLALFLWKKKNSFLAITTFSISIVYPLLLINLYYLLHSKIASSDYQVWFLILLVANGLNGIAYILPKKGKNINFKWIGVFILIHIISLIIINVYSHLYLHNFTIQVLYMCLAILSQIFVIFWFKILNKEKLLSDNEDEILDEPQKK